MTLQEFYIYIQEDYTIVSQKLRVKDEIIQRFVVKFKADPSYGLLETALQAGNYLDAFHAVHTLKGVAINLGFQRIFAPADQLTEKLRDFSKEGVTPVVEKDVYDSLFAQIKEAYTKTIEGIAKLEQ